jgi:beta-glucosidase
MSRKDFIWGAASASYQVEGHPKDDGRGLSKWDVYTNQYRVTEAVVGVQQTGNVAINAYDREQYLKDIAVMKEAGLDAYRFSLSWSRILPQGTGVVNKAGLDHYRRFVDDLLAAGIKPMVTLYHWDMPWALHEWGGWQNPLSVDWFREYAGIVFRALGDRVDTFITFNEPWVDLFYMDLVAEHVRDDAGDPMRITSAEFGRQAPAMHHLFLANAHAVREFHAVGTKGTIGIALSLSPTIPIDKSDPADVAAAKLADGLFNRWALDAVLHGTYPEDAMAALWAHNPAFAPSAADMEVIRANPVDFVGVNFYAPTYVRHDDAGPLGLGWMNTNPDEVKMFNGPVRPEAFYGLLMRIKNEYGNPPVFITENGSGFGDFDEVMVGDEVRDPLRTDYLRRHVEATLRARGDGADIRGYMAWSLFDNFEWIQGYTRRFGMVHVDFETQKRTRKWSFHAYREMIQAFRQQKTEAA